MARKNTTQIIADLPQIAEGENAYPFNHSPAELERMRVEAMKDDLPALYALHPLNADKESASAAIRGACDTVAAGRGSNLASNTRVLESAECSSSVLELVIGPNGKVLEVPLRYGLNGDSAFIDWLTFTFHRSTLEKMYMGHRFGNNDDYIMAMSPVLEEIFGFGVTCQRTSGMDFYSESWVLGDGWGNICIGGQKQADTIMVKINGTGCGAAKQGWERRVHHFLTTDAIRPCISRVDLAFDDFDGRTYSVDCAYNDWLAKHFNNGPRRPHGEKAGNWDFPDGNGRTFYVGRRSSGRYCRVYEKGMQLGCKDHPWVRIEVELKSEQMLVPFDVLLSAGTYLAGAYPALNFLTDCVIDRTQTIERSIEVNINKGIEVVKTQCGNALNFLIKMFGIEKTLELVLRNDKIPPRFKLHHWTSGPESIRESKHQYLTADEILSLSFAAPDTVSFKYAECPF